MRRFLTALLGVVLAFVIVGCQNQGASEKPMPESMPETFVYAESAYISTNLIVAKQDLGADRPSNVMPIGFVSEVGVHDVCLIQGFDECEAVALRIAAGDGYSYFKYERLCGQREPAAFEYEGIEYVGTGQTLDIERLASGSGVPEAFSYLGSATYGGSNWAVYSIQGVDQQQAVALQIIKAAKTVGFVYFYVKYERR